MTERPSTIPGELHKRRDGKHEEVLGEDWIAQYSENPQTGLWEIEIFRHDVAEWHEVDVESLDDARRIAREFYDQA